MRKRTLAAFGFVLLVFLSSKGSIPARGKAAEPNEFFREYIGLSDDQIEQVHSGKPIAKIMMYQRVRSSFTELCRSLTKLDRAAPALSVSSIVRS